MTGFSTLLIDLDQTIYPASSGIWEDVADRIHTFLETTLNLSPQEAVTRREHYYKTYGTTLRGLQREAQVEPISFMEYIHDVPIETKIKDDPLLRDLLGSINIPKYIFTNASLGHAERVLSHLGLEECFDGIIDIIRLEYANKPDPLAYKRALQIVGEPEPGKCVLIDDSLMNLETGAHMGMTTVHVGSNHDHSFTPDYSISTIHQLLDVLPELKDHDGFSEDSNG